MSENVMMQADLITKIAVKGKEVVLSDSLQTEDIVVDIVANVSTIEILAETYSYHATTPVSLANIANKALENIYVEPNGHLACINISGAQADNIMKTKNAGQNYKVETGTEGSLAYSKRTELYSFDFRDYMNQFKLALPAAAKSINIKLTINTQSEIIGQAVGAYTGKVKYSIRIVQDKSLETTGYRRYFAQTISITEKLGYNQTLDMPRVGLLDSLFVKPISNGADNFDIDEILLEKDDEKFPLKTFSLLEKMACQLHNDEPITDGAIYCNLVRPVFAQQARALKLKCQISKLASGTTGHQLEVVCEYVHFI